MMHKVFFFSFAMVWLSSCSYETHGGSDFDPKRSEWGLPLLDRSWRRTHKEEGFYLWTPSKSSKYPAYTSKLVKLEKERVVREENLFVGSNTYKTIDGEFNEELYISCDILNNESEIVWDCFYRGPQAEEGMAISKPGADSILSKWGIVYHK